MRECVRIWVLLLAVFAGQPVGHCAESCGATHCHMAAAHKSACCTEASLPAASATAHGGEHMPCIHLSLGDVQLLGNVCKKFCALLPPAPTRVPVAAGVAVVLGRGLPAAAPGATPGRAVSAYAVLILWCMEGSTLLHPCPSAHCCACVGFCLSYFYFYMQ